MRAATLAAASVAGRRHVDVSTVTERASLAAMDSESIITLTAALLLMVTVVAWLFREDASD